MFALRGKQWMFENATKDWRLYIIGAHRVDLHQHKKFHTALSKMRMFAVKNSSLNVTYRLDRALKPLQTTTTTMKIDRDVCFHNWDSSFCYFMKILSRVFQIDDWNRFSYFSAKSLVVFDFELVAESNSPEISCSWLEQFEDENQWNETDKVLQKDFSLWNLELWTLTGFAL